jgi:hypothetical protein
MPAMAAWVVASRRLIGLSSWWMMRGENRRVPSWTQETGI